mgnify:FL=1
MKKYKTGEIVTGCVTGIEKYGIFVSLDDYYNGLIHISEISDNFVRNIHDYVKIGETINAKVLEENEKEHHVKLSIKGIEYRESKIPKVKIIETPSGFTNLQNKLNYWINNKIKSLSNSSIEKK